MATEPVPLIDADLLHRIEDTARAQNRRPEEVVSDALRRYLDEQSWADIFAYGRQRAEAEGIITEEGVDQAIAEWRRENPEGGR
jgi:predicted transcriptional regulator